MFALQGFPTRALIKCWQLSVITLWVWAAAPSGVAPPDHKRRACVGRIHRAHRIKSPGISAPSGSCFSGKHPHWQCADSCLRASACCSWLWLCAKKFGRTCFRGVSVPVLQEASLLLLKKQDFKRSKCSSGLSGREGWNVPLTLGIGCLRMLHSVHCAYFTCWANGGLGNKLLFHVQYRTGFSFVWYKVT